MTEYNFDKMYNRCGSDSVKWSKYPDEVLPLWVADMDFRSPEPVIEALRRRVEDGIFGYPVGGEEASEQAEIRSAIVERLWRSYQWRVAPDELVFIPGVVTGFNLVCHMLQSPGAGVLMQTPVYYPILHAPQSADMQRQEASLCPVNSGPEAPDAGFRSLYYEIDFDAFEQAITPQTRLFILCNPHNPVGRVFRKDELLQMAEICLSRGILICSDEIHCELLYSGQRHIPIASLDGEIANQTITLMAPSKTFNIPGLKFSFAIVQNPELRQQYQKAGKALVGWVNLMGWVAALTAYRDGQEWLDQLLPYLEANRDFVYDFIRQEIPQISLTRPEGTYLSWLDCRGLALEEGPYEFFLKQARVALKDGVAFGKEGESFVRLNFGCPRATLVEALNRMAYALQKNPFQT